jgi:hypothetical protein
VAEDLEVVAIVKLVFVNHLMPLAYQAPSKIDGMPRMKSLRIHVRLYFHEVEHAVLGKRDAGP